MAPLSAHFAGLLSFFAPGVGHAYAGRVLRGAALALAVEAALLPALHALAFRGWWSAASLGVAWVLGLGAALGAAGGIFVEWMAFFEDKDLGGRAHSVGGYNFKSPCCLSATGLALAPDVFHHVAYVLDGAADEERLYLDGFVGRLARGSPPSLRHGTPRRRVG